MDTGHLREAHRHLVALRTQAEELQQQLTEAAGTKTTAAHRTALAAVIPATRELRHHAMQVAAHVGAAEAVR